MMNIRCVFVEKKKGFDVEAQSLLSDFKSNLRMDNLQEVIYFRGSFRRVL